MEVFIGDPGVRALRPWLIFSPEATHLRAGASNTLKKRSVFLHILLIHERKRVTLPLRCQKFSTSRVKSDAAKKMRLFLPLLYKGSQPPHGA
ncbi:MAG: hypothetical protein AB7D40_10720, partial [Bacteroidales bacterium]